MILYMPPTIYIAQAYSCDVYGGAAYNECPSDSTSSSSGSSSTSRSNTSTNSTTNPDTSTSGTTDTTTGTGDTSTDTGGYQNNPETTNTPADAISGMSWWLIILIAIAIAIVSAWLILLFRRRHRDNQVPPTPPIMPGGPTSPF
jgi:hypothetical protein